jgi:cell division protease FtsH
MTTPPAKPREPATGESPRPNHTWFFLIVALVVLLMLVLGSKTFGQPPQRLTPGQLLQQVDRGLVRTARIENDRIHGELQEGGATLSFYCDLPPRLIVEGRRETVASNGQRTNVTLYEHLDRQIPELKYVQPDGLLTTVAVQLVPLFLVFALVYFLLLRRPLAGGSGNGVLSFGRSRARLINEEKVQITFDDVAGVEEARAEVQEIIEYLRNPERFQRLGARIPRGALLVGPPGTGKTLLAKAIAGEAGVPFYSICGSDFVEMFVGVGASRVRDLFRQAKERSPAIIFLDEIDAVGRRRGTGLGGGHDEREQTLNAILVEMDGFHTDQNVIVLASTNRPDVLDPALLRPGRFDRQIYVDLADARGREQILNIHARRVKLSPDVQLATIARSTPGYSGADLEAVINEAALHAVMAGREAVTQADLEEARDKVRFGREKRSITLTEASRWTTAVHEAGHAIVAHLLPDGDPPHKVTIIPRGRALGVTMMMPEQDTYTMPRRRLLALIKVYYGGRVAEELLCDDVDSGAQQDIEYATRLIRTMVCNWGMSERLGPIHYSGGDEPAYLGRESTRSMPISEQTAQTIDAEVERIARENYHAVHELLASHRSALEQVARALLQLETINGDEVARLVSGECSSSTLRPESQARPAIVEPTTAAGDAPLVADPAEAQQ